MAKPGVRGVGPALDHAVPKIGRLQQEIGIGSVAEPAPDIGRDHEPRDLDREREGRIAAVLLPAVLTP